MVPVLLGTVTDQEGQWRKPQDKTDNLQVRYIEVDNYSVTFFESVLLGVLANLYYRSRSVRDRNNVILDWERVCASCDNKIAEIQACCMNLYEDLMWFRLGNRFLLQFKRVVTRA